MEWIDGIPLDVFIVKHLNDSTRLEQLAQAWMSMMAELKQGHVVHGDLQHGNILVGKDGRLRLIDYDGMFVPALRGLVSNEEGHRNYQHPQRTGRHFGPGIDSFSAWVIFISISALAVDPTLWKSLNGGDECLLFRRADFENPGRSKVLQAMEANPRPRLQALATQFRTVLSRSVENVPTLDGRPSQPVSRSSASPLPEWVADHIDRDASLTPLPADTDSRQTASAEWLFDHLVQRKPSLQVWASVDLRWERLGLVVVNLATWLVPVSFLLGPFVGLVGLALLMAMWAGFGVFLRVRYRHGISNSKACIRNPSSGGSDPASAT